MDRTFDFISWRITPNKIATFCHTCSLSNLVTRSFPHISFLKIPTLKAFQITERAARHKHIHEFMRNTVKFARGGTHNANLPWKTVKMTLG